MRQKFEPVIGLEVHAQLKTRSKAFCGCTTLFGSSPNANTCPVCLGMPGVLPVVNKNLVEWILKMGSATGCAIAPVSVFARKNYFYPDLPKGYQISQYDEPICSHGYVDIELEDGSAKRIGVTRIHMEEDAGKSIHDAAEVTLIDLNRCGVPLIEIVSEPDLRSPHEAFLYLTLIKQLVTYLDVCDGNMEEGSLRCDANVSIRPAGSSVLGTKTELKNLNSFRNVERALEFEIRRQTDLVENGESIVQQTLLWDADKNIAVSMRSKEDAHDYRYYPDPDLVPVKVSAAWLNEIREKLPELPAARKEKFISQYAIPKYDAGILTADRLIADYFEDTCRRISDRTPDGFKIISNWVMTDILRIVKEENISAVDFPISPSRLAGMINLISNGTISGKIAKEIFAEMLTVGDEPEEIVKRKGLVQISDSTVIETIIVKILDRHAHQAEQYKAGKQQLFGFFVGEAMKATKGKANPKTVNELLKKHLQI